MFPFQLSHRLFSPQGFLQFISLHCGQVCLGREEGMNWFCSAAALPRQSRVGKAGRAGEASLGETLLNAPELQEAVDAGQTVTCPPHSLQSGGWG